MINGIIKINYHKLLSYDSFSFFVSELLNSQRDIIAINESFVCGLIWWWLALKKAYGMQFCVQDCTVKSGWRRYEVVRSSRITGFEVLRGDIGRKQPVSVVWKATRTVIVLLPLLDMTTKAEKMQCCDYFVTVLEVVQFDTLSLYIFFANRKKLSVFRGFISSCFMLKQSQCKISAMCSIRCLSIPTYFMIKLFEFW